ncbi:MAG: putative Ig domain-containing protein [Opitutaceae bacterium]|nr:putative Ig domain-containing protein [Opitutaceae bacterium]
MLFGLLGAQAPLGAAVSAPPLTPAVAVNSAGDLVLSWKGAAGEHYRIETSADFKDWTVVPGAYVGSGSTLSATLAPAGLNWGPKAFWRVASGNRALISVTYAASPTPILGQAFSMAPSIANVPAGEPIRYTLSRGALPAGLTLNASTGAIPGTPTVLGAFSFDIKAVAGTNWSSVAVAGAVNLSTGMTNVLAMPSVDEFRNPAPTIQYYVDSVNGLNSNDGSSPTQAWQTLAKINALTLKPGAVVNLARGSKWSQQLTLQNSGNPDNPIVIQAYGTGAAPTIERFTAENDQSNGVVISGSYIRLLDLRVVGLHWSAIHLQRWTQYVVIAGTEISNSGAGVDLLGKHHRAISNYIHDMTIVVDTGNASTAWGANAFGFRGEDIEIAWNRMVNCRDKCKNFGGWDGGAIEFYGNDVGGLGWNNITKDVRIHHNYAENCDGFLEANGRVQNLIIAHNVCLHCPSNVLVFHQTQNEAIFNSYDARIENNTMIGGGTVFGFYRYVVFPPGTNHFVIRNNLVGFSSHLAWDFQNSKADVVHDHNLFFFMPGTPEAPGESATPGGFLGPSDSVHLWTLGEGEFTTSTEPGFVNYGAGDLRLRPNSTAVDAGFATCTSGYTSDALGTPVPVGAAVDIGAYEWR